jgi:acyl dehydratase
MEMGSATTLEIAVGPVTRTQIVRFAGVGGDFNPIHHDEEFARAAGQPSVFAMGQLTAAIVAEAIASWLGAANVTRYGLRFRDKVWPGDTLVIKGRELELTSEGPRRYELSVERQADATVVATAWVTAGPPQVD